MAVYTQIPAQALGVFLAAYDLGEPASLTGIAEGVENSNFLLRTARGTFILTLFERRVSAADLPWFLDLTTHLAARGVPCPLPVAARDGVALRQLCGRPAVVTTFLPGGWERAPGVAHCTAVGAALAALHIAGADFAPVRRNALGPAAWRPLLTASAADAMAPGLGAELHGHLDRVCAAWPDALPQGPIHADLFPDNVFFDAGRLSGLIDFYFAATDFRAYDLAICLTSWCFPAGVFQPASARALTRAYDTARALTAAERAALPVLVQGASLRFLLTRLYDWLNTPADALVVRKDPLEFLARLRAQADLPESAYFD